MRLAKTLYCTGENCKQDWPCTLIQILMYGLMTFTLILFIEAAAGQFRLATLFQIGASLIFFSDCKCSVSLNTPMIKYHCPGFLNKSCIFSLAVWVFRASYRTNSVVLDLISRLLQCPFLLLQFSRVFFIWIVCFTSKMNCF